MTEREQIVQRSRENDVPEGRNPVPPPALPSADMAPLTASAWAKVQARYVMAQARPRVWEQVRYEMVQECRNFRFVDSAMWQLSIGGKAERGFSVHFADAAARAMRNMLVEVQRGQEDATERTYVVSVTDLESNFGLSQEVVVDKYTLRRKPPRGEAPIVHRRNAAGDPLYRVLSDEQDMLARSNASISKTRRRLIIAHLPSWLIEDCKVEMQRTLKARGNRVTGQMPKDILDAFADLGVDAMKLRHFLGHDIQTTQSGELELLRSLALALREQELTWSQVMEARHGGEVGPAAPSPAAPHAEPPPSTPSSQGPSPQDPQRDPRPPADSPASSSGSSLEATESASPSPPSSPPSSSETRSETSSTPSPAPPSSPSSTSTAPGPAKSRADDLVAKLRRRRRAGSTAD